MAKTDVSAMTDVAVGCLLHDIGKVVYRSKTNSGRHSHSGFEFLRGIDSLKEQRSILDCVHYHHGYALKSAQLPENSLAYIAYIADNISAAFDRREIDEVPEEGDTQNAQRFDRNLALQSVFNILQSAKKDLPDTAKYSYDFDTLEHKHGINYPKVTHETKPRESFYNDILNMIKKPLNTYGGKYYVNSILKCLEAYLSYVPSSTNTSEIADISLYDHLKTTAATGCCIYSYLSQKGIDNYRDALQKNEAVFLDEKAFLMFSADLSGIQDFIYTISGDKALKSLRARSFYLELLTEHFADELLDTLGLCRANLMYSGGGHCYMLLPNTEEARNAIHKAECDFNEWLLQNFQTSLYIACAYTPCSGNELKNRPLGTEYAEIYSRVSHGLSQKKLNRYSAADIKMLNLPIYSRDNDKVHTRECNECHRSDLLIEVGEKHLCRFCNAIRLISPKIKDSKVYFAIVNEVKNDAQIGLPLPLEKTLYAVTESELLSLQKSDKLIRFYSKNRMVTGRREATNLWMGDYDTRDENGGFAKATGIDRIAVLRADVDNLGAAFANGFPPKYASISRSSTFSRQLSLFFKYHINEILEKPDSRLKDDKENTAHRSTVIVYSGGDDLFLIGPWHEVIEIGLDLEEKFKRFTQGKLSISAGIGMFDEKHPVSAMAKVSGELEDAAKNHHNGEKDSVCLFDEKRVFSWKVFRENVLKEKLAPIREFFDTDDERGKAFIYRILSLIRGLDDKEDRGNRQINIARLAYMLARLAPDEKDKEKSDSYNEFSRMIYEWVLHKDVKKRKELITALELYVYLERGNVDGKN